MSARAYLQHSSVPTWPYPSALSLVACRACIGVLDAQEMGVLFGRWVASPGRPRFLGWESLCLPQRRPQVLRACRLRPEQLRLSCCLRTWCPPAVKGCYADDVTEWSHLRYCRPCLERGFHSPLFQLPWWRGCPIHRDEPLHETCRCGARLRAGLDLYPARILACDACGADLIDPGRMLGLADGVNEAGATLAWQTVVTDYRQWMAEVSSQFLIPLHMIAADVGDGAMLAASVLARANARLALPATLRGHLECHRTPRVTACGQPIRDFVANDAPTCSLPLNFRTHASLKRACRRYHRALPLTERCYVALQRASRHLRRRLRIRLIGEGPGRASDYITYDWSGKGTHPHEVGAFRLLGALVQVDRVRGQPYLNFADAGFLYEPAQGLARSILAQWLGLRLPVTDERCAPQVLAQSLEAALRWLYEQCVVAAWTDVQVECFRQLRAGGVAGHVDDYIFIDGRPMHLIAAPIRVPPVQEVRLDRRPSPNRDHAEVVRRLPRGWAYALVKSTDHAGREVHAAMFGRVQRLAFGPSRSRGIRTKWPLPYVLRYGVREGEMPVYI